VRSLTETVSVSVNDFAFARKKNTCTTYFSIDFKWKTAHKLLKLVVNLLFQCVQWIKEIKTAIKWHTYLTRAVESMVVAQCWRGQLWAVITVALLNPLTHSGRVCNQSPQSAMLAQNLGSTKQCCRTGATMAPFIVSLFVGSLGNEINIFGVMSFALIVSKPFCKDSFKWLPHHTGVRRAMNR